MRLGLRFGLGLLFTRVRVTVTRFFVENVPQKSKMSPGYYFLVENVPQKVENVLQKVAYVPEMLNMSL